jgi:AraC-like DNA-binding protein
VDIVTLLPDESLRRFRSRLPRTLDLHVCASVAEVLSSIRGHSDRLLVLDPTVIRVDTFPSLVESLARTETRVLIFTRIDRVAAARVVALCRVLPVELVGWDEPNDLGLVSQRLTNWVESSVAAMVLSALAKPLADFPVPLTMAILELFAGRPIPRSVEEFFGTLRMRRRTAETALRTAGLVTAGPLLNCASLARAWEFLKRTDKPVGEVAEASGCSPTTFRSHFRALVGVSPRQARQSLSSEEVARRLVVALHGGRTGFS